MDFLTAPSPAAPSTLTWRVLVEGSTTRRTKLKEEHNLLPRIDIFGHHNNSSKRPQPHPTYFAGTAIVVALGRSMYFSLSQSPPKLSAQLYFYRTATETFDCIYLHQLF